jgi:predicted alpha-1,2-mannosidase
MRRFLILLFSVCALAAFGAKTNQSPLSFVRPMMGTGPDGRVIPMAAAPFGMVQLGPDTYFSGPGYHYSHDVIWGISHTHHNGCGGTDFQDISFFPATGEWSKSPVFPDAVFSKFSHEQEWAEPGYYKVNLLGCNVVAELTATERCGVHRYTFPKGENQYMMVDMKKGCEHSCTLFPDEDHDTVLVSNIEVIDNRTIRGTRVSEGWAPEEHVYFYARFSRPFTFNLYDHKKIVDGTTRVDGLDTRAILTFDKNESQTLEIYVGISPVSMEGAEKNLNAEVASKKFDDVKAETQGKWNKALSQINVTDADSPQKETFYTCLYFALLYPQLWGDVDGSYRSSDAKAYKGNFRYFAGTLGLWDTFRAHNPLISILHPDVSNDLMKTFLEHYRHCGQLPIWTLAGMEDMCMTGYHAMPIIADAYSKGIRDYDAEALFKAMKASACKQTFGYFLKGYRGAGLYMSFHYCPCDYEVDAASKTLEYSYDDWCIAQMAKMLGHDNDYKYYIDRAGWYKNIFDKSTNFMRGRRTDGAWRTPFDPFYSDAYRLGEDYCEGNAWQYTFFVPQDPKGLMNLMGGRDKFAAKLDSMFSITPQGLEHPAEGQLSWGQYNHGNQPSHHVIYMYDYAGEPWKCQQRVSYVLRHFYNTSPTGFIGNEDTGSMSAWFIMSAMGFYPFTQGEGRYVIGSPLFNRLSLKHAHGTLVVTAKGVSEKNCFIQSVKLNGKPYSRSWVTDADLFSGDAKLEFVMGPEPNKSWGVADADIPPSMTDELAK